MTKLPERNLLDGTKSPETTTGEFRLAMGNLIQYLLELLGDESMDKETARRSLGIDLRDLDTQISVKADRKTVDTLLAEKADVTELAGIAFTGSFNDLHDRPNIIPSGLIAMWSGTGSEVPEGWVLCDGSNGTPDLSDRFILGAGKNHTIGETGGASTLSGNTGATTLTIAQMPSHSHKILTYIWKGIPDAGGDSPGSYDKDSEFTGGGQSHAHSLAGSIMPPFFVLAFIMKV